MTSEVQQFLKRGNDLQHEVFQRINHPYSGDESLSSHVPHRRNTSLCVYLSSLRARASFHCLATEVVFNPGTSRAGDVDL